MVKRRMTHARLPRRRLVGREPPYPDTSIGERLVVLGACQRVVDAVRTVIGDRHRRRIGSARSICADRRQAMLERLKAAAPGARLILRGTPAPTRWNVEGRRPADIGCP